MSDTELQIKIKADVAELKAALAAASTSFAQFEQSASTSAKKASTQTRELETELADIATVYAKLAEAGTLSADEQRQALELMRGQIEALQAEAANALGTADEAAGAAGQNVAQAMEGALASAKESLQAAISAVGSGAMAQAQEHIGVTAALLSVALNKLRIMALEAGATFLGGFANPAAQAMGAVSGYLATLLGQLALLVGAFKLLEATGSLWVKAFTGELDDNTKQQLELIAKLKIMQDQLGSTAAEAQALSRALKQLGISEGAPTEAARLLKTTRDGGNEDALKNVGVDPKLAADEKAFYADIAKALEGYKEGLDRVDAAKSIGISNAAEFIKMQRDGAAETERQREAIDRLGLTMSESYIKELEEAQAVMRRVQQSNEDFAQSIKNTLGDAVRPVLVNLGSLFQEVMEIITVTVKATVIAVMAFWRTGAATMTSAMIAIDQGAGATIDILKTLGAVASKVFSGNFSGAVEAASQGFDRIRARAMLSGQEIKRQFTDAGEALDKIAQGAARGQTTSEINAAQKVAQDARKKFTPLPPKVAASPKAGGTAERGLGDAQFALEKARLEAEQKLQEDALKESLKAYELAYKEGLVALDGYYAAREAIERERLDKILALREKELAAAKRRQAAADKAGDAAGSLRAQAEVVKLEAEVSLAKDALARLKPELERLKREAQAELDSAKLKIDVELAQLKGQLIDRAQMEAMLREQYKALFDKFKTDPVMTEKLEKIVALKIDAQDYEQKLKSLDLQARQRNEPLERQAQQVQGQQARGEISNPRAQRQLEAIRAQQVKAYEAQIAELRAELDKLGDSAEVAQTKLDLQAKIGTLQQNLQGLKPAVYDLGVTLENSLEKNLNSSFDSMIDGAKNARQAFSDLAASVIRDVAKMISKYLIMKAMREMFGDAVDVKPDKDKDSSKPDAGKSENDQAAASAAQTAQAGEAVKGLQTNSEQMYDSMDQGSKKVEDSFSKMTKSIVADIGTMIAKMLLMKAVKMMMGGFADGGSIVGGGDSGGAGLAGFADGGAITGPGGPRDDVIPIMASAGEHMMDAKTVAMFGHGFFNALRAVGNQRAGESMKTSLAGTLSRLGSSMPGAGQAAPNPGAFKFANGGAMPAAAGATSAGRIMSLVQNFHVSGNVDQRSQQQMAAAAYAGASRAARRNS